MLMLNQDIIMDMEVTMARGRLRLDIIMVVIMARERLMLNQDIIMDMVVIMARGRLKLDTIMVVITARERLMLNQDTIMDMVATMARERLTLNQDIIMDMVVTMVNCSTKISSKLKWIHLNTVKRNTHIIVQIIKNCYRNKKFKSSK